MKILVIGSGGREHALCWKLAQSDLVTKLYALPGNAGISSVAECVPGDVLDIKAAVDFAERQGIDLTVVGPESPLIIGMADEFERRRLKVFGPNMAAAQMEGSKVFAKQLMMEAGIPTAACEVFEDADKAAEYIRNVASRSGEPIVVKADGEAAGKGVFVCKSEAEALGAVDTIMREKAFGASGNRVVIEDFLDGPEATLMYITDGATFISLSPAQDYKRAYDNDEGLNTGGMGCYSPVPVVSDEIRKFTDEKIVAPALAALKSKGIKYKGVLYCGLALTSGGPKVVEFNSRFGDPETQVALPLLESDLAEICMAAAEERLDEIPVNWYNKKALCVVMASGGYPGSYEKGKVITGIEEAERNGAVVFHAGTDFKDGNLVTSGGRVLGVTAVADDFESCIDKAYEAVGKIHFDGVHFRTDIGKRLLA